MIKPKNLENLTECVRINNDKLFIYCVECDKWTQVAMLVRSNVLLKQGGIRLVKDIDEEVFICSHCEVDIEYLLSPINKTFIRNMCKAK